MEIRCEVHLCNILEPGCHNHNHSRQDARAMHWFRKSWHRKNAKARKLKYKLKRYQQNKSLRGHNLTCWPVANGKTLNPKRTADIQSDRCPYRGWVSNYFVSSHDFAFEFKVAMFILESQPTIARYVGKPRPMHNDIPTCVSKSLPGLPSTEVSCNLEL